MNASEIDPMNGWYRIGIVLSVLWFVSLSLLLGTSLEPAGGQWTLYDTEFVIGFPAISLALLWLVALIIVAVVRWIAAGFRRAKIG